MSDLSVPKVVLDTNVVLDWLVFDDQNVAALARAVRCGQLRWIATASMRQELVHMLGHQSLLRWAHDAERALVLFDTWAQPRDAAPPSPLRCSDPDDQCFIDLALAEGAAWLVTRDKALLRLARHAAKRGTRVCRPGELQGLLPGNALRAQPGTPAA